MKRLVLLTILMAAVVCASAKLDMPDFKFIHYSTDNGLPSNCIRDICQDNDGFIWFATDCGLVRFDGVRSVNYLPDNSYDPENAATYAMTLCLRGDDIVVGIARNVYFFDRKHESLRPLSLKYPAGMRRIGEGEVKKISCGRDGSLWVSVEGCGVYHIAGDNSVKARYEFPEINDYMSTVFCDSHGNVWGASTSGTGGLYRFDSKTRKFTRFPVTIGGKRHIIPALSLFEDSNRGFWVGTWTMGLLKIDPLTGQALDSLPEMTEVMYHIHSIEQYSPSCLLVGSERGLTLYDTTSRSFTHFRHDEHNRHSLSNQFVYPVIKDREGGVWVGTFYGGVNYTAPDTKHIRSFTHSEFFNSVCGNVISCIEEDVDGNIWIGSDDGGICRYDPTTGLFRKYSLKSSCSVDNVHALCADGDKIWVGTYTGGAGMLDPATGSWHPVPLEDSDVSYSCYAIHKDRHGTVWMAANDCLNRYDPSEGKFVVQRNIGSWIVDIAEDRDGRIWVATQGKGLFSYSPYHDTWTNFLSAKESGNLPHNHVNKICVTADNEVIVATVGGIGRYDREENVFEKIPFNVSGGSSNSVEKIGDVLWISTSSGLYRCHKDGETDRYTNRDGLPCNEFSSGASLVASDGRMYLGTVNGLCSLFPSEIKLNEHVPPLFFTGLEVVNREVAVGSQSLPESLNSIDKLVLTHEDHTFSVYFSALSYANPECNSYAYRLEGFDKDWIKADKDNRATYSNLPPGNYRLHVKASNNDGIWNEAGIILNIEVLPVWYASWWMKLTYLVVILAVLFFVIRYERLRKDKEHKSELLRVAVNKEREMFRARLSFFTIVAHEIRTPVSLIIGPLEKVIDAVKTFPKSVRDDLSMIDSNARRLLSLVNQLLDFKKVEESALPMEFRHMQIIPLVESVVERFKPSVEHRGAVLAAEYPKGDFMADVSPESFTKLVSNLLNNARKFTKDRIQLCCEPDADGNKFIISVEDNGIGIRKENLDKIFTPFYQIIDNINESRGGTGLGLSIVKGVAEGHGGSVCAESEPGKWSRFIVTLPMRQENVIATDPLKSVNDIVSATGENATARRDQSLPVMLVVDDNVEMLSFISSSMEGCFEVITAENGSDALEILRSRNVMFILCDWMMPVMDGLSLLRVVRADKDFSHIPFVMLTAKTDTESKVESMKAGADAYVEKPFSMSFLKARISNILEMRRLLRDKYSSDPLEPMTTLASHPEDNRFLEQLNSLIDSNVSNPDLDVDFLASKLCISRTALYSKIKTFADVTPHELIKISRLKKAAQLLTENKYTVSEVSVMTGFASTSYFGKCFSRQFGITPGNYAQTCLSHDR